MMWTRQLQKFSIRVKFRTTLKVGQQDHRECWSNCCYCQSHFIPLIIVNHIWKLFILLTEVWYAAVCPFAKLSWSHYPCVHKPGRRVGLHLQWAVPALLEWVTLIIPGGGRDLEVTALKIVEVLEVMERGRLHVHLTCPVPMDIVLRDPRLRWFGHVWT